MIVALRAAASVNRRLRAHATRSVRRRFAVAALVAALAALAACADDAAPVVHDFALTAPAAAVELVPVPGDFVDLAWTYDADRADDLVVSIAAVSTTDGSAQDLAFAALADRTARYVVGPDATGLLPVPPAIPAGVYRVVGRVGDSSGIAATADAPGLLVMQGVTFRERELTFTADVTQRDLWMTTVTATVARVTLYLTDPAGAGRWVISTGTIASDLAPVGRVVTFTGRTVDDEAIPAGDYDAVAEVSARGGAARYEHRGLRIHWRP